MLREANSAIALANAFPHARGDAPPVSVMRVAMIIDPASRECGAGADSDVFNTYEPSAARRAAARDFSRSGPWTRPRRNGPRHPARNLA